GQGLVHGVVDQLVDEVVQPLRPGVADVHARPLADVGRVAEVLDVLVRVAGGPGGAAGGVEDGGGIETHGAESFGFTLLRSVAKHTSSSGAGAEAQVAQGGAGQLL